MKTQTTKEVLQKAKFLARKMWEHGNRAKIEIEAEESTFADFRTYCLAHGIDPRAAEKILIEAGYSLSTAKTYAHRIRDIKRNPQVAEAVIEGEITFNEGSKQAREARGVKTERTTNRDRESMQRQYQREVVRAIRTAKELGKTKQQHIDFVASNWDIKP